MLRCGPASRLGRGARRALSCRQAWFDRAFFHAAARARGAGSGLKALQ
jgi:hypothetical protein